MCLRAQVRTGLGLEPVLSARVFTDPEETVKASDISTELRQVRHEAETFLIGEQIHQSAGVHTWIREQRTVM